jgi:peptidoglycan DL-endopeptidase LytE
VRRGLQVAFYLFCIFALSSSYVLSAVTNKAKNGDSHKRLTKKHHLSTDKRKNPNGLTSGKVEAAQRPVGSSDSKPLPKLKAGTRTSTKKDQRAATAKNEIPDVSQETNQNQFVQYKIAKGDTLESLAEKFDLDKDEILDLNGLRKKRLKAGKVIRLPKSESESDDFVALTPEVGTNPMNLSSNALRRWKSEDERGMLVKVAKSFAGAPYRYGGDSVRGLDCSAFVKKIYEIFEVQLPRSAREQYCAGQRVPSHDIATGDLVFFRTKKQFTYPTHVGIYIGDGRFIHASSYCQQGVRISSLSDNYYAMRFIGAVRVKTVPDSSEAAHPSQKDLGNNS